MATAAPPPSIGRGRGRSARPPACLSVCLSVSREHSFHNLSTFNGRGLARRALFASDHDVGARRVTPAACVTCGKIREMGQRSKMEGELHSSSSILYLQRSAASISILHHHHHHHLSLQSVMKDEREHVMRRGDEKRCMHKH